MRTEVQTAPGAPTIGIGEDCCDRCCAAGYVHVLLRSGLDLVFCGHHARQFESELRRSGALMGTGGRLDALVW
jgi:hypothetical protein